MENGENNQTREDLMTKFGLSRREMEHLERAEGKLELEKFTILSQAAKARFYFRALVAEGFDEPQALEIVKYTLGLLRG